ncbi:MAG: L,D-transpeptidase family protein [Thermomicrobiales bacterium]
MTEFTGTAGHSAVPDDHRLLARWPLILFLGATLILTGCTTMAVDNTLAGPAPSPTVTPPRAEPPATTLAVAPLPQTPEPPASTPAATATPAPPMPTAEPTASPETQEDSGEILDGDPAWHDAIHTLDGAWMGVVQATELNIRSEPSTDAPILTTTFARHTVTVYEMVTNQDEGGHWFRIGDGRYVSADFVTPFIAPPPPETFDGHWVDVNLSSFYAIAYDGDRPVYSAIITAGRDDRTPIGTFQVFYRVRDETMDSATVGIPKGSPEYYYLDHVMYTQYFKTGGFALHGNYWTPSSEFGGFTSNGCIGLLNADAGWFWRFLGEGSTVSIHY